LSVISGFYYIRIIRFIFFTNITEGTFLWNISFILPFVILGLVNLFFILFFDNFSEYFFFLIVDLIIA
jgi:hypothetical protein